MSNRPKTQESLPKQKPGLLSGESGKRNSTLSSPKKQNEKAVAEISMKEFLDFLKISYQVSEAIDNPFPNILEKETVDWKKLTTDSLVNRLKEREAVLSSQKSKQSEYQERHIENIAEEVLPVENINSTEISSKILNQENSESNFVENNSSVEKINPISHNDRPLTSPTLSQTVISGKSKKANLLKKRNQNLKKGSSVESELSHSGDSTCDSPVNLLKKKLNEVLQEGIFDSVLPYLLPKQQQQPQENPQQTVKKIVSNEGKSATGGSLEKISHGSSQKEKVESTKKSQNKTDSICKIEKKDTEVVIHVCDEVKNLKKDFKCSQKLLVSHMGYFAEVTTGQKLEDMDISVHCDVNIFDWLMRWVQKDNYNEEHWPTLDPSIVIPVLMSSAFLQMNSLEEHCLKYCKSYINDIIMDSPNLNCLNDNILTRLANLFSNTEVESIVDKKDKIQSKLFCKLIISLTDSDPQPFKGHFSSLATIYRCSKCLKLILRNMSGLIHCVPSNMIVDQKGFIRSTHINDFSWNLTDYVKDLKTELKSWRRVYWRLWADCHLLFCTSCEEYFPVHHMTWCRFHLEAVQYFPLENQRSITYPIGRYPCCGEKAYRFELLKKISGCQYREHIVNPKTIGELEILRIWSLHKDIINIESQALLPSERLKVVKTSKDNFWWEGLELIPSKQQTGLLTKLWDTVIKKDDLKNAGSNTENKNQKSPVTKVVTNMQPSMQDMSSYSDSSDESSCSSNCDNSEESYHGTTKNMPKVKSSASNSLNLQSGRMSYVRRKKKKKKRKKKNFQTKNDGNRFWVSKLSTRCNQDNQREFEERALRQIESILAKKLSGESFRSSGNKNSNQVAPAGGIYVKLEQDWREAHCYSHGCPGSSLKPRGTASVLNMNNSSFSVHRRSKSRGHR